MAQGDGQAPARRSTARRAGCHARAAGAPQSAIRRAHRNQNPPAGDRLRAGRRHGWFITPLGTLAICRLRRANASVRPDGRARRIVRPAP